MAQTLAIAIKESSQIGEARRAANAIAGQLGFDDTDRGRGALIATEMASNLLAHAGGGELLIRSCPEALRPTLELLSLDCGPGIRDLARALEDGHSTAGTKGEGLGAIRRQSQFFDVYSPPNSNGTALVAHVVARDSEAPLYTSPSAPFLEIGAVCVPVRGETVCGDAWAVHQQARAAQFLVADGLGHGPHAAEASQAVIEMFLQNPELSPSPLLESAHKALRSTRGAAGLVVHLDAERREARCAGIGNVSGALIRPEESRNLVSHNGTIGHSASRFQEFIYSWSEQALLILHSDGIATQWKLERYPGLARKHPALIAGILYRDFKRGRDDATVVVARVAPFANSSYIQ